MGVLAEKLLVDFGKFHVNISSERANLSENILSERANLGQNILLFRTKFVLLCL